jgi:hypothetical protein
VKTVKLLDHLLTSYLEGHWISLIINKMGHASVAWQASTSTLNSLTREERESDFNGDGAPWFLLSSTRHSYEIWSHEMPARSSVQ